LFFFFPIFTPYVPHIVALSPRTNSPGLQQAPGRAGGRGPQKGVGVAGGQPVRAAGRANLRGAPRTVICIQTPMLLYVFNPLSVCYKH
jgi:hypothetical protein